MERFKLFMMILGYIWLWLYTLGALIAGMAGVTDHFTWTSMLVFLSGVFGASVIVTLHAMD